MMNANLKILKQWLHEADAILLGAGSGLSAAAGFEYGGDTFLQHFRYMHERYGYDDMYMAGFHNFESSEEKWGFWSKFIFLNRFRDGAKPLYRTLFKLLQDKNYFVLTTNVDHQFQLAGFDKQRLFYTQGDYGLFQCSKACHATTYDNEQVIRSMVEQQFDYLIPHTLIPHCPVCGAEMDVNLRKDDLFVEDDGWHMASERYKNFLKENQNKKILFFEVGVGFNTPAIIKYPFIQMTYAFNDARYVCLNRDVLEIEELKDKSLNLEADIATTIQALVHNV